MKKFIKLIPAALALVALASCSQDDLFSKENSQKAVEGKTMTASIESYENLTRAAFAENKNDAGKADKRALVWTVGDSYKVYGELATADQYTLQNASAGKANGVFDLMTEDYNTEPAFAVFPYDGVEADRASKKLTVTLNDWTYATATVKDEGYNQGAFKSTVPMYGQINAEGNVAFGYMTALLRVDLQKLPKKMTRLIVATDRPLTGTFETEFDPTDKTTYPQIVSPVSNDKATESYSFDVDRDGDGTITAADNYDDLYFLAVGTESVNQRTNKTFFIAVPTGNKYKTFDVLVEYNMGSSKKYEIVAQLGANDYGKVLKWERGKVKSLSKEITVTSGANTPKDLAAFLKAEWKSFPADAEINITVTDPTTGNPSAIDLTEANPGDNVFEVPAEIQNRVINIIAVDDADGEAFKNAGTKYMTIQDEDPAPVASAPLRLINICGVEAGTDANLILNCPETQVVLSVADPTTDAATYNIKSNLVVAEEDGLVIAPGVTTGDLTIKGGALVNAGTAGDIKNLGDNDVEISGTTGFVKNLGTGALTIAGTAAKMADITGYVTNGDGTDKAGKLTIKNAKLNGKTITNQANADNGIEIENVDQFNLQDSGKGAVTITKVTTSLDDSNIAAAASLTLSDIAAAGTVKYTGAGAFSADAIKGAVTEFEATAASSFSVTGIEATVASLKYAGTGAATITGDATKAPAVTAADIKGGDVSVSNVKTNTTFDKKGTGAFTIENSALGTVTNAGGTITATGGTLGKSITSLTQNGAAKVTLSGMQDVTTLTLNADADVDYENTFIGTLATNGKQTNVKGTKASGIGTATGKVAGKFTCETDTWDGTSKSTTLTDEIYTSASLAKLQDGKKSGTVKLYLNLDMGNQAFAGVDVGNTQFFGLDFTIKNLNGSFYATKPTSLNIQNLTLDGVTAAKGAICDETNGKFDANTLTVKNVTLSATANAGGLVGTLKTGVSCLLKSVNVEGLTIASASTGKGTDINLGGFFGEVIATGVAVELQGCNVKTASIKGHYYMGGFIGQVTDANNVYIYGTDGAAISDKKGSTVEAITFTPISADGTWSTYKCGTIAPFIGGIKNITATLNIYGKFDSFDREANMWKMNFLSNEDYKFMGTKQDDCNFIGYIDVISKAPTFTYKLKHLNGFQANPSMKIATTGDNGKEADAILATDCNVYAKY